MVLISSLAGDLVRGTGCEASSVHATGPRPVGGDDGGPVKPSPGRRAALCYVPDELGMTDSDSALRLETPGELAPEDAGLYERLRGDLVRAVRTACPSWLAASREDLVQAAMIKVMGLLRRMGPGRHGEGNGPLAASYLYRVAYSAVVDEIRARRRRPETPIEEEHLAAQPTPQPDPATDARGREIGRGIRGCLEGMKEERRAAVTLHLLGHSVPEAARLLGWSAKQAENLVYRGLADLRSCLERKGLAP
jgi:RNA polymerase sigma-70 factor (ECF subfamily)